MNLLFVAIEPKDFQVVDLSAGAEAEVQPRVRAGCVATARKDVGTLADATDGEEDFGAGGVPGRFEAGRR